MPASDQTFDLVSTGEYLGLVHHGSDLGSRAILRKTPNRFVIPLKFPAPAGWREPAGRSGRRPTPPLALCPASPPSSTTTANAMVGSSTGAEADEPDIGCTPLQGLVGASLPSHPEPGDGGRGTGPRGHHLLHQVGDDGGARRGGALIHATGSTSSFTSPSASTTRVTSAAP